MSKHVLNKYETKTKVTFFFHDFKAREANPEGFDSKMKSWMHVIEEYVLDRDDPLVSIDDLRKHLITLTLKPTVNCLRLVLTNMMLHGEIMSESQFAQKFGCKKDGDSSGWLTWGVSGVRKMLSWGTATQTDGSYTEVADESIGEKHRFVYLKALEKWGGEVNNHVNRLGLANQCLEFDVLEEKIREKCAFEGYCLELILMYLQSKDQCALFKEGAIKLVKFGENAKIDQRDSALFRLRVTKNEILKQIEETETEIDQTLEKAREQVRAGNKFKAKQLLRRKQRLEMFYDKQQKIYDTIEASETKIQQTDSNKLVVETMNDFAAVYKVIQPNLDDVQSLQENMDEIFEKEDKYNHALDKLSKVNGQADDAELERELNEILDENILEKTGERGLRNKASHSPETIELETRLQRLRQSTTPTSSSQSKRLHYGLYDE